MKLFFSINTPVFYCIKIERQLQQNVHTEGMHVLLYERGLEP